MSGVRWVAALVGMSLVLAGCGGGARRDQRPAPRRAAELARNRPAPTEAVPLALRDVNMIDGRTGWARSDGRCTLRSEDGGAHWQEVTPAPILAAGASYIDCINYLWDGKTAWVIALEPGKAATIYRTADGGRTWSAGVAVATQYGEGSARMEFADTRHGWLEVLAAGMGALQAELFRTEDGGKTWVKVSGTQLATPGHLPFGAEIRFVDAHRGWLAGAPRAAGGPPYRTWFYRTSDGGKTWVHQDLPIPAQYQQSGVGIEAPIFFDRRTAVMPVIFMGEATWLYATEDGGEHWQGVGPVPTWGPAAFISREHGWVADNKNLYETTNGGRSWEKLAPDRALQAALSDHSISRVDFVDDTTGWVLLEKSPVGDASSQASLLFQTGDGGRTWTSVKPNLLVKPGAR